MATQHSSVSHLEDVQQVFQGIEAAAKLLSMHVDLCADLDTDLIAATMVIAREANHGVHMVGEIMEAVNGGAA